MCVSIKTPNNAKTITDVAAGTTSSISHAPSRARLQPVKTHRSQLFLLQTTQTADKITK